MYRNVSGLCFFMCRANSQARGSRGLTRNDLVYRAILLRLRRAQFLAAEQEVTTANLADDFGPHDVQAVAGHDAECGMRRILKVASSAAMTMSQSKAYSECTVTGAIDRRDHRDLYVENVLEDLRALAEDLVVSRRREEIEAVRRDLGAEFVARAGQDDDVVLAIVADVAERPNQRLRARSR